MNHPPIAVSSTLDHGVSRAEAPNSPSLERNAALAFPLIVDLDGTLTPTDTLIESVAQMVKRNPQDVLRIPFWILKGRAAFKGLVASKSSLSAELLPYRLALIDYLRSEKEKGRRLILATAAHHDIANAVASHLGLFSEVIATGGSLNSKGEVKLQAIRARVGNRFVYAGDDASDVAIWRAAEAAILVGVSRRVADSVRNDVRIEREFPREDIKITTWMRALRAHQWVKNLLLFVPLLTAFQFLDLYKLGTMVVAFLAFCLVASATYLANDIWDLESDRAHPRKCQRPFASGQIPIARGIGMAAGALVTGMVLGAAVSLEFLAMLMLYLALTTFYSLVVKNYVLLDVLMLSSLYTLRILAGSVAVGLMTSSWLLAFSVFIFLSLALVKRCSELVSLKQIGEESAPGRDYRVTDLAVLWPLGVGSALCAVVVFGLFISAAETQTRYASPQLLWLVALSLIYWLSRLWIKSARGEMEDDPIVYAARDRASRLVAVVIVVSSLVASSRAFV